MLELTNLKYYIKERLEQLSGLNVYDGVAKDNPTFPYIVFKLPSASNTMRMTRTDRILEIDFWNDSNDDSAILAASQIVRFGDGGSLYGLDNSFQNEAEGFYKCYWDFEGEIPDPEKEIYHFNQRYILQVG